MQNPSHFVVIKANAELMCGENIRGNAPFTKPHVSLVAVYHICDDTLVNTVGVIRLFVHRNNEDQANRQHRCGQPHNAGIGPSQ